MNALGHALDAGDALFIEGECELVATAAPGQPAQLLLFDLRKPHGDSIISGASAA